MSFKEVSTPISLAIGWASGAACPRGRRKFGRNDFGRAQSAKVRPQVPDPGEVKKARQWICPQLVQLQPCLAHACADFTEVLSGRETSGSTRAASGDLSMSGAICSSTRYVGPKRGACIRKPSRRMRAAPNLLALTSFARTASYNAPRHCRGNSDNGRSSRRFCRDRN